MKIKDLTKEQQKQALYNACMDDNIIYVDMDTEVDDAFSWADSLEGRDYWSDIVYNFENKQI